MPNSNKKQLILSVSALVISICAAVYAIYGHNNIKEQIQHSSCTIDNAQSSINDLTGNIHNIQKSFEDIGYKAISLASNELNNFMMTSVTNFNNNFGVTTKTLNKQKEFCIKNKLQCSEISDEKAYKEEALKEAVEIIKNNQKTNQNLVMQYVNLNASVLRQSMFMKNYRDLSEQLKKDGRPDLISEIPTANNS